jgi:hypothetical protein
MLAKARGISYEDALKEFKTPVAPAPVVPPVVPPAAVKPEHIPEKFWDAATGTVNTEAMAKSYRELETRQSTGATPPAVTPPAAVLPTMEQVGVDPAVAKQAAFKAASEKATAEVAASGAPSTETYKALGDLGYPKDVVDSYIAGQKALQTQYISSMYESAGGKDAYDQAIAWARAGGLTPSERSGFDSVLRSGNIEAVKVTVAGLQARFQATVGKTATTVVTGTNVAAAGANGGFNNRAEMVAAMKDKRYQSGDPIYHAEVRQKMAVSARNKIDLGINIIQGGR